MSSSMVRVNTIGRFQLRIFCQEVLSSGLTVRCHVTFAEPTKNHENYLAFSTSVHIQSLVASVKYTNQTSKLFSSFLPENISIRLSNSLNARRFLKLTALESNSLL